MTFKYPLIILGVLLVLVLGGYLMSQSNNQQNNQIVRTLPVPLDYPVFQIHELNQNNNSALEFANIEGYVVKIYTCPPCPKRALCKTCMRNNILVSENNEITETYQLSDYNLILFTEQPEQFELGKQYTFSIKILEQNSTGQKLNDVEIVGFE